MTLDMNYCKSLFCSKEGKTTLISAWVIGLITHLYRFTHFLPNHDSIHAFHAANNNIGSGRWFLGIASLPSGSFDMPWLIGLFSLLWISLTALVLVDIFRVKKTGLCLLISGLLVAFPPIVGTFFFMFTADGYIFAMLLAALSVRVSMIGDDSKTHAALSALLVCLCCGIYQAYVSFALVLNLCCCMLALVKGQFEKKTYLRWMLRQVVIYIAALAAYYGAWKILLVVESSQINAYAGLDTIGQFSLAMFADAFVKMAKTFGQFFLYRNVFQYGWSYYAAMNVVFLLLAAVAVVLAAVKGGLLREKWRLGLFVLCLIALPVFTCIWLFASPGVNYYWLMLQSMVLWYIVVLLLYDELSTPRMRAVVAVFFALFVFKLVLQANNAYLLADIQWNNTRTDAAEMITRIDMSEGEKVALIGTQEKNLAQIDSEDLREIFGYCYFIEKTLIHNEERGISAICQYFGRTYALASPEERERILASPEYEQMGIWPAHDSVRVIDGVTVVKMQ